MVNVNADWITKPTGITKCVTLVLNIVCIGLLSKYGIPAGNADKALVIVTATGGSLLVDLGMLIGYLVDSTHGKAKLQEVVTAGISAILVLTAGALAIDVAIDWRGETGDAMKAYGALCIINAVVYVVHAFFSFKG